MIKFADVGWKVEVVLVIVTVLCTAQIPAFDGVIQPTICQKLTTSHCRGNDDDCVNRYQEIECYHGVCSNETGECLCSPCWTGEKCEMLENNHIPSFEQKQLSVDININSLYHQENNFIATLNAKDHDLHKCPPGRECPCATVLYSIERGNEDSMFMIDPRKGELSLSLRGGGKLPHGKTFDLVISARNPVHRSRDRRMAAQDEYEQLQSMSNIAVTVNFVASREVPEAEVVHSRRRRSAGFASEVTFVLEKLDPWASKSEILIGERVPFRLTIWLPQQTLKPTVELLTQYESSAVMTVCDPQFTHVGGNYGQFNPDKDVTVTKYAHGNDSRFDRIVLDLGTIVNAGTDSSNEAESQIFIDFYAVLENNNATQFGEDYYVSAGVTYDDGNEIWVGQETFTPADDRESWFYQAPLITMSAPSSLAKQTVALISIDLVLENIATPDFYVDVITQNYSTDPIMYMGDFEYAKSGDSFGCVPPELPKFTEIKDNQTGLSFARLDFGGPVVNPGYRGGEQDDTKNTLTLTASLYLTNNSEVTTGDTYWFSMAMYVAQNEGVLYTQQIGITATDVVPADMSESLDFEFYAVDGYNVIVGGGIGFILNIYTRPGTSHLVVDLSLPYQSNAAVMHFWKGSVLYNGKNIPCVGELVKVFSREDNTYVDYIQFDFGRITNLDRKNPNHIDPNLLQVHFSAEILKGHPDVGNGTEFLVQAGVRYELDNKDVLWAVEIPVYSVDDQFTMYSEPEKQAQFWLANRAADNMLYNDTTVSFDLNIYIPPATTYTPLFVNISAERNQDGRPLFRYCSLTLEHLGPNFHLTKEESIEIATHTTDEGIVSDYGIDFGLVSNTMPLDRAGDRNNSYFTFELRVSWLNHEPWLENGTVVSTMVNITYGPEGTWNDTMDYVISYDMDVNLTEEDNEPEFNLYLDKTRTNQLKAGQAGVYYLETIVPPDSVASYFVDVATPNKTLSVCAVRLVSVGKNMPCFETDRVVNYWSDEEDYHRDRGYLEIGAVRNIGYESETTNQVADNLMLTQVVVKLEEAALPPNNETQPENQTFYLTSRVGTNDMYTRAETIIVDEQPPLTNLTTIPKMTFTKHTSEGRVTKGSGVVFDLDLYIPYDSTADYKVSFQSDVEDRYRATICSARVISSGWNIPCINGSFLIPKFNSTTGHGHIDLGFLDAQDITNIEIENAQSPPLKDKNNKVRVQLIARLERNETHIAEGDTIWLGASVIMNNVNEFLLEANFNATEDPISEETNFKPQFQIDTPNRNVSMTIGSTETYYIKITTPPMATPMVLNITMPTSGDEAILTIKRMDYFYVGENYACYDRLELEPEYDSKFNTSQNTSAIVDLGVLMNHGTSHIYQYYPGKQKDNEMIISLEVQLADNYDLVNGSQVEFDVKFQYSLGRSHVITEEIVVIKTGLEEPELDFNITLFNYDPWKLHQEDKLRASITVYHTNQSEAHAHAMFVYFMIPYYIEIDEDVEIKGPPFCVKASDEGVKFHFEEMFFTDTFTMWFNFSLDPLRYMPMEWVFVNTTVPLEVVYYDLNELDANKSVVLGTAFKTKTELLDLTFTIEDCSDSLGIESGMIDDCQIKSSSMFNASYDPKYGRLNKPTGWSPAARDYPPYAGNEYFEVTFGGLFRFTGIKMQIGPLGNESYVSTYRLSFSKEGLIWYEYKENNIQRIFQNDFWANGTEYNETIHDPWVLNRLLEPFNALAVRIIPITYNNTDDNSTAIPVVRFELIGCQRDPIIDPPQKFCEAEPDLPDYGYYERGFLVEPTNGYVYVCILEYVDGPTRCSLSRDNGTSWEAMDTNVANVLAVHHDDIDLEIFGLSQNRKAIMRSNDLGITWYSVYPKRYLDLWKNEPETMRAALPVPFVTLPEDPPRPYILNNDLELKGNRSFTEWGAGAEGLYRREMSLEVVELSFYPESTTEVVTTDQTQTIGTTKTITTKTITTAFMTTEEMTTREWLDLTTEEPVEAESRWGPRNVTSEYPGPWERLGTWSGPDE